MNIRKKIIAAGVSAVGVASLAVGTVAPANAVEVPGTSITAGLCDALPAAVTGLANQLLQLGTGVTTSNADLVTKQTALNTAVTDLVAALVAHIQTVDGGGNVAASGAVVNAKSSVFADKIVAENNAMTAWFEAQRGAYLTGINNGLTNGLLTGLC
jgi:hypothetical protein